MYSLGYFLQRFFYNSLKSAPAIFSSSAFTETSAELVKVIILFEILPQSLMLLLLSVLPLSSPAKESCLLGRKIILLKLHLRTPLLWYSILYIHFFRGFKWVLFSTINYYILRAVNIVNVFVITQTLCKMKKGLSVRCYRA